MKKQAFLTLKKTKFLRISHEQPHYVVVLLCAWNHPPARGKLQSIVPRNVLAGGAVMTLVRATCV